MFYSNMNHQISICVVWFVLSVQNSCVVQSHNWDKSPNFIILFMDDVSTKTVSVFGEKMPPWPCPFPGPGGNHK